jgi:hypothetical protein
MPAYFVFYFDKFERISNKRAKEKSMKLSCKFEAETVFQPSFSTNASNNLIRNRVYSAPLTTSKET